MNQAKKIYISDVTLRDGSHAIRHQYGVEQARRIARALDEPRSIPSRSRTATACRGSASAASARTPIWNGSGRGQRGQTPGIATLLLPGIGTVRPERTPMTPACAWCAWPRITPGRRLAPAHRVRPPSGHGGRRLMMSHMTEPRALARQAKLMESYGATCCYVVDSGGALGMQDVRDRFRAFRMCSSPKRRPACTRERLGVANSIVAVEKAATAWTRAWPAWARARATRRWKPSSPPSTAWAGTTAPISASSWTRPSSSAAGSSGAGGSRDVGVGLRGRVQLVPAPCRGGGGQSTSSRPWTSWSSWASMVGGRKHDRRRGAGHPQAARLIRQAPRHAPAPAPPAA